MADIEKVIKAMEECVKYDYVCGKCPYKPNDDEPDCCRDLMMDALELLQKLKPVEFITDNTRNRRCPSCNTILKGKYCHECGQAIKEI